MSVSYMGKGTSGAGTGALAGAAIGSIVPGIGTGIGAIAGGLTGFIGGLFSAAAEEEDADRRAQIIQEAATQLNKDYDEVAKVFNDFYDQYNLAKAYGFTDESGNVDLNKLGSVAKKIQSWDEQVNQRLIDAGQAEIDPMTGQLKMKETSFDYDKDVSDFLDPYIGNVINASNEAVQHSAAGAGLGRSTGAAKAIAENTAKEYDQLYNTALNAYNQDRGQAYTEWSGILDKQMDRFKTLLQADQWGLKAQQGLVDATMAQLGEEAQNKAMIAKDQADMNAKIKLAGL